MGQCSVASRIKPELGARSDQSILRITELSGIIAGSFSFDFFSTLNLKEYVFLVLSVVVVLDLAFFANANCGDAAIAIAIIRAA